MKDEWAENYDEEIERTYRRLHYEVQAAGHDLEDLNEFVQGSWHRLADLRKRINTFHCERCGSDIHILPVSGEIRIYYAHRECRVKGLISCNDVVIAEIIE